MEKEKIYWGEHCILIARVSTPSQVFTCGASPQIEDLRNFAKKEGFNPKFFKEINSVESGFLKLDDKTGWNLVTDFINNNPKYKTIIITEMSRLSRSQEVLMYLKNYLIENKIQLIIKDLQGFRLLDDYGNAGTNGIIFDLFASFAAAEMEQKKERKYRTLKEYKSRSYSIGGKKLFGYDRVCDGNLGKKKRYVINENEAALIRQVFNWYAYGINNDLSITSTSTIALECIGLGYPQYLTKKRNIQKMLKEEAYLGQKITKNKSKNPEYWNYKNEDAPKYTECNSYLCVYPRIISDELFLAVKNRLNQENTHIEGDNILKNKSRLHTTILAKIMRCAYCGSFFLGDYSINKEGRAKFTYRCGGARAKVELRKCKTSQTISMKILDSAVWAFIKEMVLTITKLQDEAQKNSIIKELEVKKRNFKDSILKLDEEVKIAEKSFIIKYKRNVKDAEKVYDDTLSKIDKNRKELYNAISRCDSSLNRLKRSISTDIDKDIENNIDIIEHSKKEMYKYIHLLIKEIVPIFNNNLYTLLQITAINNIEDVFDYKKEKDGLPTIMDGKEKHDGTYFLAIKKKTNGQCKARVITDNQVSWNNAGKCLCVGGESFTLNDIFNMDLFSELPGQQNSELPGKLDPELPGKLNQLTLSTKELNVKILDFYNEDLREEDR